MDVDYSLQPNMDMHTDPSLEFEDDDVFYAELRRQILLLTADDDDKDFLETKNGNSSNVIKPGGFLTTLQAGNYFNWWENVNISSTPVWLSNLWRNSNGTGVFIPHIVKSRRKPKSGRMNTERGRKYKWVENNQF